MLPTGSFGEGSFVRAEEQFCPPGTFDKPPLWLCLEDQSYCHFKGEHIFYTIDFLKLGDRSPEFRHSKIFFSASHGLGVSLY